MAKHTSLMALCSAVPLDNSGEVPDWVHLLPAGDVRTADGRGPYRVKAMQSICAASIQPGKKLPLDEAHSTDKGAALGQPHPARGWITQLEPRDDGIWGKVDWTKSGTALMEDKAYAGISPAILHDKDGNVLKVLRASLTNTPNLVGLTSLHSEEVGMDLKAMLIELLGLDSNADDATIAAALKAKLEGDKPALQSQNLAEHPVVLALQSQMADLAGENRTLKDGAARSVATAYVDGEIAKQRVGLKPLRDEYISMHMENSARTVKLIEGMPIVENLTVTGDLPPTAKTNALGEVDHQVMALFGVDEETYKAELAKGGRRVETL